MKQAILINLLLWAFILPVLSQQSGYRPPRMEKGYVYLKNGTILQGKYMYSPELDKIRVITKEESRVYDVKDIDKASPQKPQTLEGEPYVYKPRKFSFIVEGGILFGNPDNDRKSPFILGTSVNYALMDGLSAGLGTGLEFYNGTYLPVTANIHYRFGTNRVSPFVTVQAGYLIALESNYYIPNYYYSPYSSYYPGYIYYPHSGGEKLDAQGGLMINPAVGAIIETDYGFGVSLSIGYRYHKLKYEGDANDYNLSINYNRLSLKLGIIF